MYYHDVTMPSQLSYQYLDPAWRYCYISRNDTKQYTQLYCTRVYFECIDKIDDFLEITKYLFPRWCCIKITTLYLVTRTEGFIQEAFYRLRSFL